LLLDKFKLLIQGAGMKKFNLFSSTVTLFLCSQLMAGDGGIQTKYPVTLYGYIKGDVVYDSAPVSPGNYYKLVPSEDSNVTESEYFLTANQTRLGLNFAGPKDDNLVTGGKIEVGFYGGNSGGASENKSHPMLRKAYLTMYWPQMDFEILAGQTSDVFSPIVPKTVNYSVDWWVGDIGYRRPQLRFTKGFGDLTLQGALARNIGGETTGSPNFQFRLAYKLPLLTEKKSMIGVSGHSAVIDDTGSEDVKSSSLSVEFALPLTQILTLKANWWQGENMAAYLGNAGQADLEGSGYWAHLAIGPFNNLSFNVVYSVDDPDEESTDYQMADGAIMLNSATSFNAFYKLNKAVTWANEISLLTTEYKGALADGSATRFQTSFIFAF
jgi:hypothetical protein